MMKYENDLTKLFYYSWYLNTYSIVSCMTENTNIYELKLSFFFRKFQAKIYPQYAYGGYDLYIFGDAFMKPLGISEKIACARYAQDSVAYITDALHTTLNFGIFLPQTFCDLVKCYQLENLNFSELEFRYIDAWLEVPLVLEELLLQLVFRDAPFCKELDQAESQAGGMRLGISPLHYFPMRPPYESNKDVHEHLKDYYFGENSHSEFLEIINLYLDNRPNIKKLCLEAGKEDKNQNIVISENLSIYFVCHFLLKRVSQKHYLFCFLISNTDLLHKDPFKIYRDNDLLRGKNKSDEEKFKTLFSKKKAFENFLKDDY